MQAIILAAGMLRCHNREEADRLLLEYIKTLGYKKLAQAYNKFAQKGRNQNNRGASLKFIVES